MRILLLGEYSNVHWTLAQGLRALGHEVTVVSDGDGWKNYPRDIDLTRKSTGKWDTLRYLWKLKRLMPTLKGYDVVQVINPIFLDLRAERILPYYRQLRRQNKSVFMGAFGMDKYWVKVCLDGKTFRYSDFNIGSELRQSNDIEQWKTEWLNGPKGEVNEYIAQDCDGIISGLYEYDLCYRPYYGEKVKNIPFPIEVQECTPRETQIPIRFFIGIQSARNAYKGTDIMLHALERLKQTYPDKVTIEKAENVPFPIYQEMIERSDVLLDQLYSYTPAMNGLLAMSKGMVIVGGGEEDHYENLGEKELRPIINVQPTEEDVYEQLEQIVLHPEVLNRMKAESITYIKRHHDHIKVAQQYQDFWQNQIANLQAPLPPQRV